MGWIEPKTDWNSSQQGVTDVDFNRIEGNIAFLGGGGDVEDVEGNRYPTVVINGVQWTTKNWASLKFSDGTAIPEVIDQTEWASRSLAGEAILCGYNNNSARYGVLYSLGAVTAASPHKLAPEGWRVASFEDWEAMLIYLAQVGYKSDFSVYSPADAVGLKMSESIVTQQGWPLDAIWSRTDSNTTGLSVPPSGRRTGLEFAARGDIGYVWAPDSSLGAYGVVVNKFKLDTELTAIAVQSGMPVRMVRDV